MHFTYYLETKETKKAKNIELWIMNLSNAHQKNTLLFKCQKQKLVSKPYERKDPSHWFRKEKLQTWFLPHDHINTAAFWWWPLLTCQKAWKKGKKYTEFHILRKLKKRPNPAKSVRFWEIFGNLSNKTKMLFQQ